MLTRSARLPAVRKRARLAVQREVKREWPRHRRFVRKHECIVSTVDGADECTGRIEFSHVRSAADAGEGLKPHDWYGVPCCEKHHKLSHRGAETFMRKYGLDLWAVAALFVTRSPDTAMREAMKECALPYRTEHGGRLPVPPRREAAHG